MSISKPGKSSKRPGSKVPTGCRSGLGLVIFQEENVLIWVELVGSNGVVDKSILMAGLIPWEG